SWSATATITVSLSDGSATLVEDSIRDGLGKFTIQYRAASDDVQLIVETINEETHHSHGNHYMNLVTLAALESEEPEPAPEPGPTVSGARANTTMQSPPSTLNVTEEGTLDWMHFDGGT